MNRRSFLTNTFRASVGGSFFPRLLAKPDVRAALDVSADASSPLERVLETLTGAAVAILPFKVDLANYGDCIRWQYERVEAVREPLTLLANALDAKAVAQRGAAYSALDIAAQRALLAEMFPVNATEVDQKPAPLVKAYKKFRSQMLQVFARKDAFRALGYSGCPETSCGLEAYETETPGGAS